MDPAHGETQGKSLTSKLKAKVKGVKGKVHLPGHKKRHGGAQGNDGSSSDNGSSDDSPQKPGPETGYNLGESTPYTTVKNTPLSPERRSPPHETHDRDYEPPSRPAPASEEKNYSSGRSNQTGQPTYATSTTEPLPGYSHENPASNPGEPSPGIVEHMKQTVGGAAAAVGSKMGYYNEVEDTPHVQAPSDPNAPSMMEKTKAALGMDKPADPNAPSMMEKTKATLGMDKPADPNAPSMMEKTKATLGMDKPADPNAPSMMEKTKAALGMDKPADPNAPSVMDKTKATLGLSPTSPSTTTAAGNQQPGIVDRVSGAVSSLFGSSPKGTGEDVQHTFPAHSDYVPKAGEGGVEDERVTTSSTPGYKTTVN